LIVNSEYVHLDTLKHSVSEQ